MRSICCVSVPRSSFMLCAVSMLSRAVSRHRARCRQTAQQFDVEPHCCVSVPCPSSGHLVARFGRARTRNYARCHHAGRTFHVSKCCVSVPCSWVLVIRDFDSRSYYSAAPLSLCHQAGRQCAAGPVLRGWSVSLSLITHDSSTWKLGNTALRSVPPCGAEARCGACAR